jgi:leucyl aminopeptidase
MRIEFVPADTQAGANAALAVLAHEAAALSSEAQAVNAAAGGALARAVAGGRFTGAKGQTLDLIAPAGLEAARVVLVGVGADGVVEPEAVEVAAGHAYQAVKASGVTELVLKLGGDAETAARAAFGAKLAAYRFDKYRTTEKAEKKPSVA